ncbi:MAG: LptF/LptG family permease [Candidatus Marinimicrobia bacterium]|nr:LptF/LptG family permease [Candidatus Neomarinimicrobiota bacterium]
MKRANLDGFLFKIQLKTAVIIKSFSNVISAMRLLNRYIQKELFLPFCYSLLIIIFILFTNFLLRAVDRFLGKGIDLPIILEYLFFNLAWIVSLAVPMAVLIAALMTFGRMSEDNEINAMRASGISFLTIIRPAVLFGITICMILIYFNNFILPEMNFRARLLSGDIYRKRPGLNINPGHFIDDIPDYSMIIKGKRDDIMEDVRIFSKNNREVQTSIHSNTGTLSTIEDAFILTLFDGEIHEMDLKNYKNYRRIEFMKHVITVPADDLLLNRRDSSSRTDREMAIPSMLERKKYYEDRISKIHQRLARSFKRAMGDSIFPASETIGKSIVDNSKLLVESDTTLTHHEKQKKLRRLNRLESQVRNEFNLIKNYSRNINKYSVEIHKKFSLPFACILFAIAGASLGVLTKKGGFAIGTSLSLGFFIVYYIFLIGGEDMADRDIVSPFIGLWTPNFLLLIVGLYLTLHTVRERAPFQMPNLLRKKKTNG